VKTTLSPLISGKRRSFVCAEPLATAHTSKAAKMAKLKRWLSRLRLSMLRLSKVGFLLRAKLFSELFELFSSGGYWGLTAGV
jgi:hypothetical protein